jgi:hypothetical protein
MLLGAAASLLVETYRVKTQASAISELSLTVRQRVRAKHPGGLRRWRGSGFAQSKTSGHCHGLHTRNRSEMVGWSGMQLSCIQTPAAGTGGKNGLGDGNKHGLTAASLQSDHPNCGLGPAPEDGPSKMESALRGPRLTPSHRTFLQPGLVEAAA